MSLLREACWLRHCLCGVAAGKLDIATAATSGERSGVLFSAKWGCGAGGHCWCGQPCPLDMQLQCPPWPLPHPPWAWELRSSPKWSNHFDFWFGFVNMFGGECRLATTSASHRMQKPQHPENMANGQKIEKSIFFAHFLRCCHFPGFFYSVAS